MITDDELYMLAIFLGSMAMLLIIGYHYLEVNAKDEAGLDVGAGPVAADSKKTK